MKNNQTVSWGRFELWASPLFMIMSGLFVTVLLTANVISVKLISLGRLAVPVGVIVFPLSYIINDVLTEVYGYRKARSVIYLGFICNAVMVAFFSLAIIIPAAGFWGNQAAFATILATTPRLLCASFVAYLIGGLSNAWTLSRLKVVTRGRLLWVRTIGSTVIGEGLDSLVFISIAFSGNVPLAALASMVIGQWLVKTVYEIIATPLTYMVVGLVKRTESVDTYDSWGAASIGAE